MQCSRTGLSFAGKHRFHSEQFRLAELAKLTSEENDEEGPSFVQL